MNYPEKVIHRDRKETCLHEAGVKGEEWLWMGMRIIFEMIKILLDCDDSCMTVNLTKNFLQT